MSATNQIAVWGHLALLPALIAAGGYWLKSTGQPARSSGNNVPNWLKFSRRFERPLPMIYLAIAALSLLAGLLNATPWSTNAVGYRLPRLLYWWAALFFGLISAVNLAGAGLLGLRFIYLVYLDPASAAMHRTHLPSLILLAVLAIFSTGTAALAVIANLLRGNRRLSEEILYKLRRQAGQRSSSGPASFLK